MKVDCVRVIEASYASLPTSEAWLAELLAPFEPLTLGWGVLARTFELGGPSRGLRALATRGPVPEGIEHAVRRLWHLIASAPPEVGRTLLAPPPSVCWSSHRVAGLPDPVRAEVRSYFAGTGMRDSLGIAAVEPGGSGMLVSIPYPREVSIPPRTFHQLTRVTAHLCSAIRLRSRSGDAGAGAMDAEAVLDPSGKVRHAEGPARSAPARASLTAAVRNVERARGRLRRTDPDEALAIWLALFEGRWSIVERTEADGRRFLLARRNDPGVRDPKALSQAERNVLAYAAMGHSNKYIGYLLGIATSTVSSRLTSALLKLGLGSRREAIEMLGGAAASRDHPPPGRPGLA